MTAFKTTALALAAAGFAGPASAAVIASAEFDGSDTWSNNVASSLFVDPGSADQGLFIQAGADLGPDNVIFGRDLSNEPGEPQLNPVTLTFDGVDVSGLTDITVGFAYDLDGFDSTDSITYDVFADSASIATGTFGGDDAGVLSVPVLDGTSSVSLTLVLDQNGAGDSFELDSFEVNAVPEPASFALVALGGAALLGRRRSA
ncbi:PEP-CTERM sorting domain-containing protein [Phycisphaera mikurensis]|uniref:Ice-binding protein C-terminal domain-containing protein n=1 Tax=Phycisphaera mikurensis (strain NBRC 102666 / KCTC 22515 / FYK2301M01) TaxID=1142394 RepID=I0IA86_PHYMF|nr:PEP-CTERM sorting domain-containing protein [Phycisphaera mikurensis]MBB6441824.1 hypothetical protein [Phycisphaera mikurensis]BAM02174.1 hypothetical protein PSMK_00150 [Phycisphaera mikurensis NBRC 102666]